MLIHTKLDSKSCYYLVNLNNQVYESLSLNQLGHLLSSVGDTVAQWLMHWTLGQEAWVWDVARSLCCVLRENTQPLQYGILVGNVVMNWHPIQGGVVILLLTSCLGKWDKFQLDGPLNSSTDQFFYLFGLPLILLCYLSPPSNLDNCQFVPSISKQTCRRARKEPSVPTCDLHLTQKNT